MRCDKAASVWARALSKEIYFAPLNPPRSGSILSQMFQPPKSLHTLLTDLFLIPSKQWRLTVLIL